MLQRLHLTYSPQRQLFALGVGTHQLRIWMTSDVVWSASMVRSQETPLSVESSLDVDTGHVEILGMTFLNANTLVVIHADGILQCWHISQDVNSPLSTLQPPSCPDEFARDVQAGVFEAVFDADANPPCFDSDVLRAVLCWEISFECRLKSADFKRHPETQALYGGFGGVSGEVFWMKLSQSGFVVTRKLGHLYSCVNLTTLSDHGLIVATSCRDHRVAVWRPLNDEHRGKPWRVFEDSSAEIWSLAISHSTRYLAGGGIDNGVYLWDLEREQALIAKRYDHSGWISDLAWSDHDRVLASSSWDNTVGVYRGTDLMPLYQLELHTDYASGVVFIPDTTMLVSAGYDQKIAIWDWSQASLVRVFDEHKDWVQAIEYVGENVFVSASSDRAMILWSAGAVSPVALLCKPESESMTAPSIPLEQLLLSSGGALALEPEPEPEDVARKLREAIDDSRSTLVYDRSQAADISITRRDDLQDRSQRSHVETWPEMPPGIDPPDHQSSMGDTDVFEREQESASPQEPQPAVEEKKNPFARQGLRIDGESLSSGRLRSPMSLDDSGVHSLQEASLAAHDIDVLKFMEGPPSSIVILAPRDRSVLSVEASSQPSESAAASSSHQEDVVVPPTRRAPERKTKEISRDSLMNLFKKHLESSDDSEVSDDSQDVKSEESSAVDVPEEDITQSLFGDLTEVFEDSLQSYLQTHRTAEETSLVTDEPQLVRASDVDTLLGEEDEPSQQEDQGEATGDEDEDIIEDVSHLTGVLTYGSTADDEWGSLEISSGSFVEDEPPVVDAVDSMDEIAQMVEVSPEDLALSSQEAPVDVSEHEQQLEALSDQLELANALSSPSSPFEQEDASEKDASEEDVESSDAGLSVEEAQTSSPEEVDEVSEASDMEDVPGVEVSVVKSSEVSEVSEESKVVERVEDSEDEDDVPGPLVVESSGDSLDFKTVAESEAAQVERVIQPFGDDGPTVVHPAEIIAQMSSHDTVAEQDELSLDAPAVESADGESDSELVQHYSVPSFGEAVEVSSPPPRAVVSSDELDELPSADDAPTMSAFSTPPSLNVSTMSPAMKAAMADEESSAWDEGAPPGMDVSQVESKEDSGLLSLRGKRVQTSSGVPLAAEAGSEHVGRAPSFSRELSRDFDFSLEIDDGEEDDNDHTYPGFLDRTPQDQSGAAPFMGRPATQSREPSAAPQENRNNMTFFGGLVYKPGVEMEPEFAGNEITAEASNEQDVSEPISQVEITSNTPEWEMISVAKMWSLRHNTTQSNMKIFRRRVTVNRLSWSRVEPIDARLHNTFSVISRLDEDYFAAAGATRHLMVWQRNGELAYQLPVDGRIIYALTATPDGRILVCGDDRAHIDMWLMGFDANQRGLPLLQRARLHGHTAPISHLSMNSSGRLLLSAALDSKVRLWNLEDGSCVSELDHNGESISSCDFWGSGLSSVSLEGVLRIWDRRGIQIDLVEGHAPLTCLASKRNRIYFGSRNGEVFCYERGQTKQIGQHNAEVTGLCIHLDGTLLSSSRDGTVHIHYDQGQNPTVLQAQSPLTCLTVDGSSIFAGTEQGALEVFKQIKE